MLTHGHIDHVWDAARIQREHGCRVGYHRDTEPMITEADFFRRFGFGWDIEPVNPDLLIEETDAQTIEGIDFQILLVPGHCDPTINLYDWYVCVRNGVVEQLWPVSARGALL